MNNIGTPLIILGAGRSGTNVLRDTLTSLPEFVTWPCDELPYLWRTGNRSAPTDELGPNDVKRVTRHRVRHAFARLANTSATVVEKTCANSLRPEFVAEVVPEAKYVLLIRDGRDVVASAMERWTGETGLRYILEKVRFAPIPDIPYYAVRQARWAIAARSAGVRRSWGPRFDGIDDMRDTASLAAVSAMQWKRCVERCLTFADARPDDVHILRYEDFVVDPQAALKRILRHVGSPAEAVSATTSSISPRSVGSWQERLTPNDVGEVEAVAGSLLEGLEYR